MFLIVSNDDRCRVDRRFHEFVITLITKVRPPTEMELNLLCYSDQIGY